MGTEALFAILAAVFILAALGLSAVLIWNELETLTEPTDRTN
jgi:hypothetical protein